MAKYECKLNGDFNEFLNAIHKGVLGGSISASYEDGSLYENGQTICAVRVYERYSMMGNNRVSLNVTLVGNGDNLFLSAITSGGSQAMFFKINTFGEKAFLNGVRNIVEKYESQYR